MDTFMTTWLDLLLLSSQPISHPSFSQNQDPLFTQCQPESEAQSWSKDTPVLWRHLQSQQRCLIQSLKDPTHPWPRTLVITTGLMFLAGHLFVELQPEVKMNTVLTVDVILFHLRDWFVLREHLQGQTLSGPQGQRVPLIFTMIPNLEKHLLISHKTFKTHIPDIIPCFLSQGLTSKMSYNPNNLHLVFFVISLLPYSFVSMAMNFWWQSDRGRHEETLSPEQEKMKEWTWERQVTFRSWSTSKKISFQLQEGIGQLCPTPSSFPRRLNVK